jgi:hypothetical protein
MENLKMSKKFTPELLMFFSQVLFLQKLTHISRVKIELGNHVLGTPHIFWYKQKNDVRHHLQISTYGI